MKKILLGLGSMVAVSAPVIVAVSCGDESTTVITKTVSGFEFTITDGHISHIKTDGSTYNSAREIGKKIIEVANSPEGVEAGIKTALPEHEVDLFGMLELTGTPASHVTTKVAEFATNHDENAWETYRDTQSSGHGTNPGSTTQKTAINIDDSHTITVDLGTDTPTELRTKFEQFRTMYNTDAAKFLVKVTMEDDSIIQMVFIMKPGTTRANSFMTDTDSYGLFDITLGAERTAWALNYGDSHAFDFFTIAEPAWITKINSESTTDQDVTQFDWTLDHP